MAINPSKIIEEFSRIKNMSFLENVKSDTNAGGAGNTFEYHLGVKENNLVDADFEGFEIKTKKQFTNSAMSLFTKKPTSPVNGDNYMREKFGIPDTRYPNVKCFRTSIYAHRFSLVYEKYKMKIKVDRNNKKIVMKVCDTNENLIDDNVYWSFDDIKDGSKKLENMFVVNAEQKKINGKDHFHYTDALVLLDYKGFDNFLNLINEGKIRYDNRLGVHGPDTTKAGRPHNHGGGLRIQPKEIKKLFNNIIEIN